MQFGAIPEKFAKLNKVRLASNAVSVFIPVLLVFASILGGADEPWETAAFAALISMLTILTLSLTDFHALNRYIISAGFIFLVWAFLGKFGNWHEAHAEVLALLAAGAVFLMGRSIGMRSDLLALAWRALIWALLAYCVIAIISQYFEMSNRIPGVGEQSTHLEFTFGSKNTAATLVALGMLIGVGRLFHALRHQQTADIPRMHRFNAVIRENLSASLLVIFTFTTLLMTQSRAGVLLGLAIAFVLIAAEVSQHYKQTRRLRWYHRALMFAPLLLAVALMAIAMTADVIDVPGSSLLGGSPGRLELYSIYWNLWQEAPWFGHGLGSFKRLNDTVTTLDNAALVLRMGAAHNVFLQWLIQQGVVGLTLMTGIFALIHIPIFKALSGRRDHARTFLRIVLCVTCLVFVHGMVDYALEIPSIVWTYAFLLGLASGRAHVVDGSLGVVREPQAKSEE